MSDHKHYYPGGTACQTCGKTPRQVEAENRVPVVLLEILELQRDALRQQQVFTGGSWPREPVSAYPTLVPEKSVDKVESVWESKRTELRDEKERMASQRKAQDIRDALQERRHVEAKGWDEEANTIDPPMSPEHLSGYMNGLADALEIVNAILSDQPLPPYRNLP